MSTKEEAIQRLKQTLPLIFIALQEANETGKGVLAIAAQNPDGGGKMEMTINEPEDLLKDLALALEIPYEPTEEQLMMYRARALLAKWGAK